MMLNFESNSYSFRMLAQELAKLTKTHDELLSRANTPRLPSETSSSEGDSRAESADSSAPLVEEEAKMAPTIGPVRGLHTLRKKLAPKPPTVA